jgi:hypothetical protein
MAGESLIAPDGKCAPVFSGLISGRDLDKIRFVCTFRIEYSAVVDGISDGSTKTAKEFGVTELH